MNVNNNLKFIALHQHSLIKFWIYHKNKNILTNNTPLNLKITNIQDNFEWLKSQFRIFTYCNVNIKSLNKNIKTYSPHNICLFFQRWAYFHNNTWNLILYQNKTNVYLNIMSLLTYIQVKTLNACNLRSTITLCTRPNFLTTNFYLQKNSSNNNNNIQLPLNFNNQIL